MHLLQEYFQYLQQILLLQLHEILSVIVQLQSVDITKRKDVNKKIIGITEIYIIINLHHRHHCRQRNRTKI